MNLRPSVSLGLSTLLDFRRKNRVPLDDLEQFEDHFEQTGVHNGEPIWTPRIAKSEDQIRYLNDGLMHFVWHFRDFFWVYAQRHLSMTRDQAVQLTKSREAGSIDLQICGYFTNKEKHEELDNFRSYPQFQTNPPRLGEVWVHFLMANGDVVYKTDFIGATQHQISERFAFIQTVEIEGIAGVKNTRRTAEEAAWEWILLLQSCGVAIGVSKPQWFACQPPVVDFLSVGQRYVPMPPDFTGTPIEWSDVLEPSVWIFGAA